MDVSPPHPRSRGRRVDGDGQRRRRQNDRARTQKRAGRQCRSAGGDRWDTPTRRPADLPTCQPANLNLPTCQPLRMLTFYILAVDSLRAKGRALQKPHRSAAGHARPDHPADPPLGATAWLRHQSRHQRDPARGLQGRDRIALSGTASSRKARLDCVGVEDVRQQAAREVLPPTAAGKNSSPARNRDGRSSSRRWRR